MPQDARSLASPERLDSPTAPPRHISARDVRDLALAVVEGAVAAEALAKELKRSPDRSRHFQDIAERLRAVVGRASIRNALADEPGNGNVVLSSPTHSKPGAAPSVVAPIPTASIPSGGSSSLASVAKGPPPIPKTIITEVPTASPTTPTPETPATPGTEEPRASGERVVPPLDADALIALVTRALHGDEISTRLARLEHAVAAASKDASETARETTQTIREAVAEATAHATMAASAGERIAVSTPAEALSLATRLTERVQAGMTVTVRVEAVPTTIRRG